MRLDCTFCDSYQENKRRNLIIYENTGAYSILNYKPSVPGHSLIIPKQHIVCLKELHGVLLENFIQAIPLTFEKIQEIFENNPKRVRDYYTSLVTSPPEPKSKVFALQMLNYRYLSE